jgi:crossover junction endodeoxyribonuclease RuvC
MRVLAFDPGYERLGAAVIEKQNGKEVLIHSRCVRTAATLPFEQRLFELGQAVEVLIAEYAPGAMALEEVFFEKNAKTAMQVAEVRGMLSYIAQKSGLKLFQYTPSEVKVAVTGHGASNKTAVSLMVRKLLSVPEGKKLDDELDAIAVGITCLASAR